MAAKSKTKSVKKDQVEVPSVPVAIRDKKPSGTDLLGALAGSSKPAAPKKKSERPELELTPEAKQAMRDFAPLRELAELFGNHCEQAKARMKELIFPLYVEAMWRHKTQPQNPALRVDRDGKLDIEGTFVVKAQFSKIDMDRDQLVNLLVDQGLQESDAQALVENEIDFTPQTELKLNALLNGYWEGKAFLEPNAEQRRIGEKIAHFLMGHEAEPLTDEERDSIRGVGLITTPVAKVKPGFFERVCGYCHSKEQLAAVFALISPIQAATGFKFGVSDTKDVRDDRLIDEAERILGITSDDE